MTVNVCVFVFVKEIVYSKPSKEGLECACMDVFVILIVCLSLCLVLRLVLFCLIVIVCVYGWYGARYCDLFFCLSVIVLSYLGL